jgi:ACS family glucarate transporter-like MFS transporter
MLPTNIRYRVLLLACTLSMLTYLDRACFGAAAPTMVAEFGLNSVADLRWAITAFAIAYGLFEIPSGWWGDRFGVRKVLLRIVLWWSFFTVLTGLVGYTVAGYVLGGVVTLAVIRFLFGMGEAGAYPNIARALHNWFPVTERGRAQGFVWMSGRLMGGLTPLIWTLLVSGTAYTVPLINWRMAFLLFGLLGVVWCIVFAFTFRNRPDEHPKVNEAERELIASNHHETNAHEAIPWSKILFNRNLVFLYLMYFGITYGWYFNMTYLPSCLETRYGVESTSVFGAILKGGPLWLGAVGCIVGGILTDRLLRNGRSLRWARRGPGLIGLVCCAFCYLIAAYMPDALSFAVMISLAAFFNDLVIGGAWSTCQDIGGKYTGIVGGCMNTAASAGAAVAGWISGKVLDMYLQRSADSLDTSVKELPKPERVEALVLGYQTNLLLFAVITLGAALCWCFADADRRVE